MARYCAHYLIYSDIDSRTAVREADTYLDVDDIDDVVPAVIEWVRANDQYADPRIHPTVLVSSFCIVSRDTCDHKEVDWRPIEIEYQADGTAEVWQQGDCKSCGRELVLSYNPGEVQEP